MTQDLHIVCPHCTSINRVPASRLGEQPKCGSCRRALFDKHPVELNANTFERHVAHNDIPLVVDFWAPWCGPCRMMAPAYEQAATLLEPDYRVAKVNTEAQAALAARFGIRSIPTLAVFKNNHELARQAGAMGAGDIVRWVRSISG